MHSEETAMRLSRGSKRAYGDKDTGLYGVKADPFISMLKGDPRYNAFLRKMKLPE